MYKMNNLLETIDPLDKPTNTNFFYADEKMHYLLVNKDIQTYLDYCSTKHHDLKYPKQEDKQEDKQEHKEREYYMNKQKKLMLESIWSNIINLENTINKFTTLQKQ
jgi:hypothetical protein